MLFEASVWTLIAAELHAPLPRAAEKVTLGSTDLWNLWRKSRIKIENEPLTDINTKKNTYDAVSEWYAIRRIPEFQTVVRTHTCFEVAWTVADIDEQTVTYTMSCAKWETMCLLARVIVINLREWAASKNKCESANCLVDVVACSRRALQELKEWWDLGDRKAWSSEKYSVPVEMDYPFFETTRALAEMLYEFSCLARATSHEEMCARDYHCVLMSITNKSDTIAQYQDIPACLETFVDQVCNAVTISVGQCVWNSVYAMRTLNPPSTIQWKDVCRMYEKAERAVRCAQCFDDAALVRAKLSREEFRETLDCAHKISNGTLVENLNGLALVTPSQIPFASEYPFPFDER
jgi:hypothetical protein